MTGMAKSPPLFVFGVDDTIVVAAVVVGPVMLLDSGCLPNTTSLKICVCVCVTFFGGANEDDCQHSLSSCS